MALFFEPIDFQVNGLWVRQYSDMCYSITTDPEGNDGIDSAEYPEIHLTFMNQTEYSLETYGATTYATWDKLLKAAEQVVLSH